jgi:hypothetical protein
VPRVDMRGSSRKYPQGLPEHLVCVDCGKDKPINESRRPKLRVSKFSDGTGYAAPVRACFVCEHKRQKARDAAAETGQLMLI